MEPQKSKINTDGGAFIEGHMNAERDAIGQNQINTHSDTTINHNYFTGWSVAIALLSLVLISLAIYSMIPESPPTQTPNPYFSYKILVQDEASRPLEQAEVTLHIRGDLVLPIERTDKTGLAVFSIPIDQEREPARLSVELVKYKTHTQEISLFKGTLPNLVLMEPE